MWVVLGLIGWLMAFNTAFLLSESISIWHYLLCIAVSAVNYLCYRQVLKCWELQLPAEAYEYYYDVLALNSVVSLLDPYTHYAWYPFLHPGTPTGSSRPTSAGSCSSGCGDTSPPNTTSPRMTSRKEAGARRTRKIRRTESNTPGTDSSVYTSHASKPVPAS